MSGFPVILFLMSYGALRAGTRGLFLTKVGVPSGSEPNRLLLKPDSPVSTDSVLSSLLSGVSSKMLLVRLILIELTSGRFVVGVDLPDMLAPPMFT